MTKGKTIKVLVADDEEKINTLICRLVDWEELHMEVVATAGDGIEALEKVKEYMPHIVITDIRMPGYDGLELIRRIREAAPETECIIISGYRHFEYARSAIQYGVKDYILKPVKKSELENTLRKMMLAFMEKEEQLSSEEQIRIRMKNNSDRLREAFMLNLLLKKERKYKEGKEKQELDSLNEEHHFHFQDGCFQIIAIRLDGVEEVMEENVEFLDQKVLYQMDDRLKEWIYDGEYYFENDIYYGIMNYAARDGKAIRKALKKLLDELMLQKEIFENLKVTIGVGSMEESIDGLGRSLSSALLAIEQRIVTGTDRIIEITEEKERSSLAETKLFGDFNEALIRAVELLNEQEIRKVIGYLQDGLKERQNLSGHEVLQMCKEAMQCCLFGIRQNKFPFMGNEQYFQKFQRELMKKSSWEEVFAHLERSIVFPIREILEQKEKEDNKPIRKAKEYIMEHYNEPVTLEEVSSLVGFNSTYFSSLFKKETNTTFSDYLIGIRMEKAKEMLRGTNMSVASICHATGYSDLKHFTRTFYKVTSLKPNEYRKLYS